MMNKTYILIEQFENHLNTLNRSPNTVKSYVRHVKHFMDTITISVKKINKQHIENYIAEFYDKQYSSNTISMKIRSIKRFFEYLEQTDQIFIDPSEQIKEPREKQTLPKDILTIEEANQLLEQPDLSMPIGIRDRSIMELFYSTGIRLDELCSLKINDVDISAEIVRVNNGKGQKDRIVPMGDYAAKFLDKYITKVRPHLTRFCPINENLFVNMFGHPIDGQSVYVMIKKYSQKAGINKEVSAHTFRHTFACLMLKNGADIRAVQKMLGHERLYTTQRYIRSLKIDLKKIHENTHPREKDHTAIDNPPGHKE